MELDLVLHNANVITVDEARPRARAVAVHAGRIVAVGDETDVAALPARRRIDVAGATVVPAFNDAHQHLRSFGERLAQVALRSPPIACIQDILDALGTRAASLPPGEWVCASGYDHNKLAERRHPTRAELDRAVPAHPVLIEHTSGHCAVANSAALALARVDEVPVPAGGLVVRDAQGRATGLLEEKAQQLVSSLLEPPSVAAMARHITAASAHVSTEGVASVQEAGIGCSFGSRRPLELAAWQRARRDGGLRVRATLMVGIENLHAVDRHADDADGDTLDLGLHTGFGDEWLRIGPAKIFADGSLLGRTCAMCDPFADTGTERGYFVDEVARLREQIVRAHLAGWQVATHAIGDRAVATVLDIYADALARAPRAEHRHRIEHCGVCRSEDVSRMARMGVIPVPQGRFVGEIGDGMAAALGPARIAQCYRGRSFLAAGLELPGSSDRPVVAGAPLLGIHDLVNRRTENGMAFAAEEALTPEQALRAWTLGSAYAAFDEHHKGSIAAGKLADLAVLDRDITRIAPETIAATRVLATFVGGELVHDRM